MARPPAQHNRPWLNFFFWFFRTPARFVGTVAVLGAFVLFNALFPDVVNGVLGRIGFAIAAALHNVWISLILPVVPIVLIIGGAVWAFKQPFKPAKKKRKH